MHSKTEPGVAFLLGPELRQRLELLGSKVSVPTDAIVFSQGAKCEGVFLLRTGAARIYMLDENGNLLTCRNVGPGSILGLPATLCQQPYMFTAETTENCSFGFITSERFQEFLRLHPELCMEVVQLMSSELAIVNRKRIEASQCTHHECGLRRTCSSCN